MASYIPYTPDTIIARAMFNFDVSGIANFKLDGVIRVSASDAFSHADYVSEEYSSFYSAIYTSHANEVTWTSDMAADAQQILDIFSQFAHIDFEWKGKFDTSPPGSDSTPNPEDVGRAGLSDINISWIYRNDVGFAGLSGINSDGNLDYTGAAGDIFLNSYAFGDDLSLGLNTRARQTLIHELGHSLGLSHPHSAYDLSTDVATITTDYAATRNLGFSKLGFRTASAADMYKEYFSVMSYDDQQSVLSGGLFNAHTPMILDVIALQQAYGEGRGTTGPGDDTITAGTAGYRTYFDKGGVDTIDLSLYTDGAYLRMGETILGAAHLVGVAMSVNDAQNTIAHAGDPAHLRWFYGEYENANGASNNDILYGNALDNVIRGLAGNDSIDGGAGSDEIDGGSGSDTIVGGAGNDASVWGSGIALYTITKNGGDFTVTGSDGTDLLTGIERLRFTDAMIRLGGLPPLVDFNGEGNTDIVLRNDNGTIQYRLMNGVTLAGSKNESMAASWKIISTDSDFNGDGKSDVVLRHDAGMVEYRLMNGANVSAYLDQPLPTSWKIVGTDSDFNGDGKSDVLLRNDSGTIGFRLMNGLSLVSSKDEPVATSWKIVSMDGDFNGDGKSDLLLRHDNGTLEYRLMDGANMTAFRDETLSSSWKVVSTDSDLNGDGKSDVVLRHDNGTIEYRLMNGLNISAFRDEALPSSWKVVSADSDFNGDGTSDVVLRNDNGQIEYRLMNGLATAAYRDESMATSWKFVSASNDFDGDGKSDVVLRHDNGTIEYRVMDGLTVTGYHDDSTPTDWHLS